MKLSMQANIQTKTLSEGFNDFVTYKKSNNVSESTLRDYINIISIFIDFYGENSLCVNINEETVQKYICWLQKKPKKQNNTKETKEIEYLSSVTIATYIRHLRAVLNYFMKKGYTPIFTVSIPKFEKDVKEAYTPAELELLLKKPDLKKCSFSEYRNWVMTNYFLSTANRLETARNIKIKDLHFEDDEIYLRHVKNRKPYCIPMQKELKKILIEYLSYRHGEDEDYLFCNENDDKKPLSNEAIKTVMARYNNRRGVQKTSVHIYRNTFAKYWILKGGDLLRLQRILGHKNLDMVKEYVDMYGEDLKIDFDVFNPLSAFSKGSHISLK